MSRGEPMTDAVNVADFRRQVRQTFPHVKVSVRTVSFEDLARCSRRCLSINGELRTPEEHRQINAWAEAAGIVPDNSIRCYTEKEAQP